MNFIKELCLVSMLLAAGCTGGPLDSMDRLNRDPEALPPTVRSFTAEKAIEIEWRDDPAADTYILYRSEDSSLLLYEQLYRGEQCSFTDTDVADGGRYLYRLGSLRDGREFGPSEAVLGVGSLSIQDLFENNDTKERASVFRYQVEANVYYFQDNHGRSVEDVDWFSITVPPRHRAYIALSQTVPSLEGESETFLYFLKEGDGVTRRIIQGEAFPLVNYSYDSTDIRFRISPVIAACRSEPDLGGGTVVEYTFSLVRTEAF